MREAISLLLLLALTGGVFAQEPANAGAGGDGAAPGASGDKKADENKPEDEKAEGAADTEKAEAPKEAPAFELPDKDKKKLDALMRDYLFPKKSRLSARAKLEKFISKLVDGHSVLEDVPSVVRAASRAKMSFANPKAGRKGAIKTVEIRPDVHGFPGGVGTVKYFLYLPKTYAPGKRQVPLILSLPNNRRYPDGAAYIKEMWLRSPSIAKNYAIVVPTPFKKGEAWNKRKSYGRAMIALRHAAGNFEQRKKTGGPALDQRRVFIDGDNTAAVIAARFPEVFAGAILHGATGFGRGTSFGSVRAVNLSKHGGLTGLPTYCITNEKKKSHALFAAKLLAGTKGSVQQTAKDPKKPLGDVEKLAEWMDKVERQDQPRKLEYTIHDPSFQRLHWIYINSYDGTFDGSSSSRPMAGFTAEADRATNVIEIDNRGLERFELFLNDALVDLNKEITINVLDGEEEMEFFKGKVTRSVSVLLDELVASNQPWRTYTARFVVDVAALRELHAKRKAEAKAKADEQKKKDEAKGKDTDKGKGKDSDKGKDAEPENAGGSD
ncbi:MAG: hypothetical protein V3T86_02445 [Planctomycetota bacterium]